MTRHSWSYVVHFENGDEIDVSYAFITAAELRERIDREFNAADILGVSFVDFEDTGKGLVKKESD